jgi:hypothetical protein
VPSEPRTAPDPLERIDQADRAALCQALGLTVTYRRVNDSEQVRLRATLRTVELGRVGETMLQQNPLMADSGGVELKRVGGPSAPVSDWRLEPWATR